MKRLMFIFIFFVSSYAQAAEQQPTNKKTPSDQQRIAAIAGLLHGLASKDSHSQEGGWEDVSNLVEEYSGQEQEPVKKVSWWDRLFDWFAEAMAERPFSPEVGGQVDLGYYKR